MKTYGQSIAENNSKSAVEWLDEAIEECLDQAVYLEKLREKVLELEFNNEVLMALELQDKLDD